VGTERRGKCLAGIKLMFYGGIEDGTSCISTALENEYTSVF
jgi:hypothetical protein